MTFKKGDPGGPGALPQGQDLMIVKRMSRQQFELIGNRVLHMSFKQLTEIMQNLGSKDIPVLELAVMSILYHAIKDGDEKRVNWLLDRLLGQAVKKIQVVTELEEDPNKQPKVDLSPGEKILMAQLYLKQAEEKAKGAAGKVIDADVINRENQPPLPQTNTEQAVLGTVGVLADDL